MSGEPVEEALERLLDADTPPDYSADPLAGLLHAAATPDPDRALRGEEAATASFRAASTPQPPGCAPRRGPLPLIRTRRGTSAALLAVALLVLAALALPRIAGRDAHNRPALTATTAPLTPPPASPRAPDTTPRPLEDNATLTSAAQSSTSSDTSRQQPPIPNPPKPTKQRPLVHPPTPEHTTPTRRRSDTHVGRDSSLWAESVRPRSG